MDPFEIPQDISTIQDLAAAEAAALAASEAILALDDPSPEDLDQLDAIADHVEALRAEGQTRDDAAQARRDRAQAARDRLADPAASTDPAPEPEPEPGTDPAPEPGADPEPGTDPAPEPGTDPVPADQTPEAVAAAAAARRRSAPSLIRRGQAQPPSPTPDSGNGITITASAGIPQIEAGSKLTDMSAVTAAFQARMRSFPGQLGDTRVPEMYQRHSVATFSRRDFDGLSMNNPEFANDQQALLDAAADEKRLVGRNGKGGSLAAAGGWCAPSETFYDLVELESASGLLDLPEVQVNRGGMRFTTGPDFSAIYAGVGFAQTEAQAIAGTTKTCYDVPCPDFGEVRLDAVGICIKAGILTNVGYPELVRRVINGALIAHQHKVSIRMINALATQLGTAVVMPASGSVARSTLTGLELAAEGQRVAFRMAPMTTMEVVLPHYARVILRDDLQARYRSAEPVTDAMMDAHFAARNLRVQFVYGYGDARVITVPGGGTLLTDFPDTIPAMLYPAGTFVKGTQDVISLDTVYDSSDLQSNVYTAMFMEEAVLLARRAPGGGRLTIPVVSKGSTGPTDLVNYGVTDV